MPVTCPHCSAAIEGFVPQETLTERLKGIGAQRDGFKAEALQAQAKLKELEEQTATWKSAAEELKSLKARTEEDAAYASAQLAPKLDHHRSYVRSLYDGIAPAEGAEKPSFAAWLQAELAKADADPFLLALRTSPAQPGTGAQAKTAPSPAPKAPLLPPREGPVGQPPAPAPQSAAQVQAYLNSPAGQALSRAERIEMLKPFVNQT